MSLVLGILAIFVQNYVKNTLIVCSHFSLFILVRDFQWKNAVIMRSHFSLNQSRMIPAMQGNEKHWYFSTQPSECSSIPSASWTTRALNKQQNHQVNHQLTSQDTTQPHLVSAIKIPRPDVLTSCFSAISFQLLINLLNKSTWNYVCISKWKLWNEATIV